MEVFTVYILRSIKTKKHYIGYTIDINKRLLQHNTRLNRSTIRGIPWEVIYSETGFNSRQRAMRREKEIKNWKGGIKFKQFLKNAGIV
ncbi:MAG: hypothetical protein UR30_C0010G0044 [Candidatus Peregrinibacteria bacterium GW2011_GWC2_33_13]|nr:MAG: hypothetical protein UR30_C0010G0044 [Candidatus Peregrinibacteria bacterium GW2011_GWC2_33_13]